MKGFRAEMWAWGGAVHDRDLKGPLKLLISYDEEIGRVGLARMKDQLRPLLGRPRLAIVGEPTEMQVAIGHKGKRSYRAKIHGEAGHSALAPQFVNALHVAVDFISRLRQMQEKFQKEGSHDGGYAVPYTTVHVGKLSGGTALNVVPDTATLLFEFRHLAEDDPNGVEADIKQAIDSTLNDYSPTARSTLDALAGYPGLSVAETDQIVSLTRSWCGGQVSRVAFGTEAGILAELGIQTLVCGPGSMAGQGHKPDEFISKQQLAACARMLRNGAKDLVLAG